MKALALMCITVASLNANGPDDSSQWTLTAQRNGISTYIGEKNEAGFKPTRAAMTVKATPEEIIAVLTDVSHYTEWVPQCDLAQELNTDADGSMGCYQVFSGPLVTDRDLVTRISIAEDHGTYSIAIESRPDRVGQHQERIRIRHFEARYLLTPAGSGMTSVELRSELNMDGIPAFLVNWVNEYKPYEAFDRLRKQIGKH